MRVKVRGSFEVGFGRWLEGIMWTKEGAVVEGRDGERMGSGQELSRGQDR